MLRDLAEHLQYWRALLVRGFNALSQPEAVVLLLFAFVVAFGAGASIGRECLLTPPPLLTSKVLMAHCPKLVTWRDAGPLGIERREDGSFHLSLPRDAVMVGGHAWVRE